MSPSFTTTATLPSKTAKLGPQQIDLDPSFVITDIPQHRHYHWVVEEMWAAPDGVSPALSPDVEASWFAHPRSQFERRSFVVNGQIEGPLIEANRGDTIHVTVENRLHTGTAFHWHGLAQNGSVWADGPSGQWHKLISSKRNRQD